MEKVTVIFTCFNRKDKTITCMKTITQYNPEIDFSFIVVDDASKDGTSEAIMQLGIKNVTIQKGNGNLFWCGGMRKGIEYFLDSNPVDDEFCLLINDDVKFKDRSIEKMIERVNGRKDIVIVGATCSDDGEFTYGLKQKEKWYKKNITKRIYPSREEIVGDTCNANCVLIRNSILKKVGNMDPAYTHSLGDYDLGFAMTRAGYHLISSEDYIGICNYDSIKGTWYDTTLPRLERLKKKESPKGSPTKEWWHFTAKNFGIISAIRCTITAHLKILLKR